MKLATKFWMKAERNCHNLSILDIIVIHYHTGQIEGYRTLPNFRLRSIRIKLFGKKYFIHKSPFVKFYAL